MTGAVVGTVAGAAIGAAIGAGTAVLAAGAEAVFDCAAEGITPVVGALAAGPALSSTLPPELARGMPPLLPR